MSELHIPRPGTPRPPSSPADDSGVPGPGSEPPSPPPGPGDAPLPDVGTGGAPELPPSPFQLGPVYVIDPASITSHRLAELLPEPSPVEQERLYAAIAVDGQQVAGVVLDGKLLDGRSRGGIREQLGLPLRVRDFIGTEAQALTYVLNANTCRRDLSAAQRACVAATVLPRISEETAAGRPQKYRETIARRQGEDCVTSLSPNPEETGNAERAGAVAVRMVNTSEGYVGYALRLQREAPELFRQVWSGQTSMPAVLRQLTGEAVPELTQALRAYRRRLKTALQDRQHAPILLARLNAVLDEFEREVAEEQG